MNRLLFFIALASLMLGCAIYLPFENRVAYNWIKEVEGIKIQHKTSLTIKWIPPSFPQRVDIQGASGFAGGSSRTRIPTGVAISSRITEMLDIAIGVDERSSNILTILVIQATTQFQYDAFAMASTIKSGNCVFEAEFSYNGQTWKVQFTAADSGTTLQGTSQTAVLNSVWDSIAFQVTKSILFHINSSILDH